MSALNRVHGFQIFRISIIYLALGARGEEEPSFDKSKVFLDSSRAYLDQVEQEVLLQPDPLPSLFATTPILDTGVTTSANDHDTNRPSQNRNRHHKLKQQPLALELPEHQQVDHQQQVEQQQQLCVTSNNEVFPCKNIRNITSNTTITVGKDSSTLPIIAPPSYVEKIGYAPKVDLAPALEKTKKVVDSGTKTLKNAQKKIIGVLNASTAAMARMSALHKEQQHTIDASNAEIKQAKAGIAETEQIISKEKDRNMLVHKKLQELKANTKLTTKKNSDLATQNEAISNNINAIHKRFSMVSDRLRTKLDDVIKEVEAAKIAEAHAKEVFDTETEGGLQPSKISPASLIDRAANLTVQIDATRAKIQDAQATLQMKQKILDDLKAAVQQQEDVKMQLMKKEEQVNLTSTTLKDFEKQSMERLQNRLKLLKDQLKSTHDAILQEGNSAKEAVKIRDKLARIDDQKVRAEATLKATKDEAARLESEIQTTKGMIDALITKKEEQKKARFHRKESLKQQQQTMEVLARLSRNRIVDMKAKIVKATGELNKAREKAQLLKQEINKRTDDFKQQQKPLAQRISKLQTKADHLATEKAQLESLKATTQAKLSQVKSRIEAARLLHDRLKSEYELVLQDTTKAQKIDQKARDAASKAIQLSNEAKATTSRALEKTKDAFKLLKNGVPGAAYPMFMGEYKMPTAAVGSAWERDEGTSYNTAEVSKDPDAAQLATKSGISKTLATPLPGEDPLSSALTNPSLNTPHDLVALNANLDKLIVDSSNDLEDAARTTKKPKPEEGE